MPRRSRWSRWQIVGRFIAVAIPGYLLANTSGILLSFVLPMSKINAALMASIFSFAILAAIVLWIFHEQSLKQIWIRLLTGSALTGGLSALLYFIGGPAT